MSDPTLCRGVDEHGNQCICMRAKDTYVDDDNRTRCTNCGHIETAHPEPKPNITSFVKGFRDAAKLGSSSSVPIKASHEEAEAETNAGLRPKKRKFDISIVDPASKKSNKAGKGKGKAPKTEGELVKYGKAVMLTCGLLSDGSLRKSKLPSPQEIERMRAAGLVVLSSPSKPLAIDTAWTNAEAKAEIARLFPKPIAFITRQPYVGKPDDSVEIQNQPWLAGIAHRQTVTLAADPLPTGVELANHCKILGRPIGDRVLYIVSKVKIPQHRWQWDESDSEDLGSEIDTVPSEDILRTPRKPAPQKKLKIKAEPGLKASDDESDMRNAAKMRTRLSTGTIKKKDFFIPEITAAAGEGDLFIPEVISDDDEEFPQFPRLAPLSPNQDPPSFYDDFSIHSPPPVQESSLPIASSSSESSTIHSSSTLPVQESSVSIASSSSLLSTSTLGHSMSTSMPGPSMPTSVSGSIVSTWESSWLAAHPDAETPDITVRTAPVAKEKAHRFKKMGKGRC
ncbi:hypothetical protein GGX14DRAFT_394288 [Mycena pura]|uniref:Uncharacterized protein n=1 Tax=Mycena pura TaxID=153505 RepID=A0AAD6YCE1_9AGAR|nr:hypothetical protein GGX14DRAFT_394288 [Mycena pura]